MRINIEDSLETDPRFIYCKNKLGRFVAIGAFVEIARVAQKFWVKGEHMPETLYAILEFPTEFIECGLVTKTEKGYYLAGSEDQFRWIVSKTENGKKGGRPPIINKITKPTDNLQQSYNNPDESDKNPPTPTPTPTPTLNTNTHTKSGDFVSLVVNAYNNICLELPKVKIVPDKRKKLILKAKKEIDGLQDLQGWQDLFKTVVNSDFLMGRKTDFKASFDWIIKLDNCTKILEGNYGARIGRKEQAENKLKEYLDSMLKQCEAVNEN